MAKHLVIVESPTKAKTISRFLGADFIIESSYGHIRDLPAYKLGVDTANNFEPQYVISRRSQPVVKKLKAGAKEADKIILATDEDREGEAIAWHLIQALGLTKKQLETTERIVFHEITKKAIEEALTHPRPIDERLVSAQQARRILDRLVGYQLSPFLWKKVTRGLSAGRVQSVAVRLIVEREREIQAFKPQEYWSIIALLSPAEEKTSPVEFSANLIKIDNVVLDKFGIQNEKEAKEIVADLEGAEWKVSTIEKRAVSKKPSPPFTTSTLQQEAWRRLRFSAKQTMLIAQQLYEGIELGEGPVGLITYMRTDSVNMSGEALAAGKEYIETNFGKNYALPSPRIFKTKSKGAQEAHEAIRPTDPKLDPESVRQYLNRNQYRLYDLVWKRFIATQMPDALFDATAIDIGTSKSPKPQHARASHYTFRSNGQIIKFDGFLKVYPIKIGELLLPELKKDEGVIPKELKPGQHYTDPPSRFTEASLVKTLEKFGIGRPSTYAPIMSTIQDRGYVLKNDEKRFQPTDIGFVVNDLLVEHFPVVVDIQFTAKMEEELDEIAEGKKEWRPVIKDFYIPFEKNLKEKFTEVEKKTPVETTDEVCEKCGKPMIVRYGRFGKFMACSGFPDCKNAKSLKSVEEKQNLGMACPKCVEGNVIVKKTRKGKIFFGCSRYPDCMFAAWGKPTGEKCPKCENPLIETKYGIKCNSKECDYKMKKDAPQADTAEVPETTDTPE
ncbi:MAG: DNA topoisomerase I [Candidatus Sungbacteria bacterium RIFCSPLOWO2_01_FULL_47_32]|uniref:DNA topoisomerase 1 n=1 Tax=Candidatus Sungbacteria bacterium RIFCSPHIGHO2_01_FULL_47_32 TaxID=1802264 RepID=A0A1G2K4H2_9BACT|nr:MAG: topoisomerase protein [Parcubacteria group bacterium GW2011_GWA2_47_10]OGZ94285.1 MAG: DNA topoisomerase I [Candidatus Sungbacteria bacterium RIFCSPHIGHO2_01_FULL_47_32]OGZ99754.1 MAG: DNA topoisomerase I [Candidatus Sungbacteria bacterium RIFCSPHIGHO2_02_FULL_46_12]OHA05926.1 MAG: DNA topoisomerase I [Candidatus Sungbacteria bacterium RIFCSPLOWO2_01_FULL_47_32]